MDDVIILFTDKVDRILKGTLFTEVLIAKNICHSFRFHSNELCNQYVSFLKIKAKRRSRMYFNDY